MLNSPDFGGPHGTSASLRQLCARVPDKDEIAVEMKHRHVAGRLAIVADELRADDALRVQPEPLAIERERTSEISNSQRDHMDARFHAASVASARRCQGRRRHTAAEVGVRTSRDDRR